MAFKVVFDLDDTLLVSSWTHSKQWGHLQQIPVKMRWPNRSTQRLFYAAARKRFIGRLFGALERRHPRTVEVQLRPGTMELLRRLKAQGVDLALVTASARNRIEFLSSVFNDFFSAFVDRNGFSRVYSAEDIIACIGRLDLTVGAFPNSHALHSNERRSLAHKTPLLISQMITGWDGYDLLVDDSLETRDAFVRHGLAGKLLAVDGESHPLSNVMDHVEAEIYRRMSDTTCSSYPVVSSAELSQVTEIVRCVDPIYLATLRRNLRF